MGKWRYRRRTLRGVLIWTICMTTLRIIHRTSGRMCWMVRSMLEHFAVWMRSAAFPIFRKLWGVIHTTLKGNYTFRVHSNYDVSKWDGEKHLILSTANAFGGRNPFLGIVYLSAAGVAVCMIVVFVLRYKFGARTEVDLNNLKWD